MNFEIKQITINDVMGLKNCSVFFNKNTIILGENNSGKTRILKILYWVLNKELKEIKKHWLKTSKIKIIFKAKGKIYTTKFEGKKFNLKKDKKLQDIYEILNDTKPAVLIEANNLNINKFITDLMQSEISNTNEFKNFKDKVEEVTNDYLKTINQKKFSDEKSINVINKPQEKLPNFKIELFREYEKKSEIEEPKEISINLEGGGFQKNLIKEFLIKNKPKFIIFDEIENHFSIDTIKFLLEEIDENSQIIASSHRIEVNTNKINSITTINNQGLKNTGTYIKNNVKENVIIIEGKNDLPYLSYALDLLKKDKILIVASGKEQAKQISKEFDCIAIIDRDDDNYDDKNTKIFQTQFRQMENYVRQEFIDQDENIKGIIMTNSKKIEEMFKEIKNKVFKDFNDLKNYFAENVHNWLKKNNPLISEIKNILSNS